VAVDGGGTANVTDTGSTVALRSLLMERLRVITALDAVKRRKNP
jgi:hypothetical protein